MTTTPKPLSMKVFQANIAEAEALYAYARVSTNESNFAMRTALRNRVVPTRSKCTCGTVWHRALRSPCEWARPTGTSEQRI